MKTATLYIENATELKMITLFLEMRGVSVTLLKNLDTAFLDIMQGQPDAIVIEVTKNYNMQIALIRQIVGSIKTRFTPLLVYGPEFDQMTINMIKNSGLQEYVNRPLRIQILKTSLLNEDDKTASNLKRDVIEYKGEQEKTATIIDRETTPSERIKIIVEQIDELLAFPFTIAKVIQVTNSNTSGAKELGEAINIDPVVVSSVLRVANSALYSRGTTKITNVSDAIVRIGFDETKKIAISFSVMSIFSEEEKSVGFSREHFWLHSVAAGVIAQNLSTIGRYPNREIPFITGLLHDFGIILLDEFFPKFLHQTLRESTSKGASFPLTSLELWGMSHSGVAERLFQSWNMPDEICTTVRELPFFKKFGANSEPNEKKLVYLVAIADILSKALCYGRECDEFITIIPNEIAEELNIKEPIPDNIFKRSLDELKNFATFLGLDEKTLLDRDDNNEESLIIFHATTNYHINPFEIALRSHGYTLCSVEDEGDASIVVIIADDESTPSSLKNFRDIKNSSGESLPLLIITDHSDRFSGSELIPQNWSTIPASIDIRMLIFAIESLSQGNSFNFDSIKQEATSRAKAVEVAKPVRKKVEKPKSSLTFKTRIVDSRWVVIALHGSLNTGHSEGLKRSISMLLKKSRLIALDFTPTTEFDSVIIAQLNTLKLALKKKGVRLELISFNKEVPKGVTAIKSDEVLVKQK